MDIFLEISRLLVVATVVAGVMHLFRQPLIIGHIITGILVGPAVFDLVDSQQVVQLFSHMGIALLLFIIGLGLNPKIIREVGKIAVVTGLGQILFTGVLAFLVASSLGLGTTSAVYVAIAMAFSSTIIILKLLSDKRDTHRLYGKVATGFLLIQDIVAVSVLTVVSAFDQQQQLSAVLTKTLLAGVLFICAIVLTARYVLPRLQNFLAQSQELLFLFSIGWGFGVAAIADVIGFKIEIGALAAGIALANSSYAFEIASRMRPLRDFFIVLFFIVLGSELHLASIGAGAWPALVLSIVILIGNPIIVMSIMGVLNFTRKTGFKAGLTVAQVSEFSLILIILARDNGHISDQIVAMLTMVAMITIACSTYLIMYSDTVYEWLAPWLKIFERKNVRSEPDVAEEYDVIIFGFKSGSRSFLSGFQKLGQRHLVVDHSPEVVDTLNREGVDAVYGDGNDTEFLEDLPLEKAKMIVITATDFTVNATIVSHVMHRHSDVLVVAKAEESHEAQELYDMGASYVMMPHYLGSLEVSRRVKRHGVPAHEHFRRARNSHLAYIQNDDK
jgi:Kef-type K+ transport system membrane component KefB